MKHGLAVLLLASCIISCTERTVFTPVENLADKAAALPAERIIVEDATQVECASGGKVYIVFVDVNFNGINDVDETPLSKQVVCNGQNGANGSNGHSMQFTILSAAIAVCPAGGSTVLMALDINDNGFYSATDPNQQQMTICNGVNGIDGEDGEDASIPQFSPVDVIIPCGNTATYKEVLLRLGSGQVLASFSDNSSGVNTRLVLIPDGTYMTTDNTSCVFTLATSIDGSQRSVSWSSQVQKTWSVMQ